MKTSTRAVAQALVDVFDFVYNANMAKPKRDDFMEFLQDGIVSAGIGAEEEASARSRGESQMSDEELRKANRIASVLDAVWDEMVDILTKGEEHEEGEGPS